MGKETASGGFLCRGGMITYMKQKVVFIGAVKSYAQIRLQALAE